MSLQMWVEQLRFEVETLSGTTQGDLNAVSIFFVFYTLVVTIAVIGAFGTPTLAWAVIIFFLFLFVATAFDKATKRRGVVADYMQLLREIYVKGLDVPTIAQRYEKLKQETPERLKFLSRKRQEPKA